MNSPIRHPASYRDPSGFIFSVNGNWYRLVNSVYAATYDRLMQTGLYEQLVAEQLLLPHTEVPHPAPEAASEAYKVLLPEQLPFISYAWEWSFEQLKEAALLTLLIMKRAMEKNLSLKDATPANVQFLRGKPVFIDTLSFEDYNEAEPWVAYRQFCETFLYPLFIEYYTGMPVHKTAQAYPNGIPATIAARLLPGRSRFRAGAWLHVWLPASVAGRSKKEQPDAAAKKTAFSRRKMENMVAHLTSVTESLTIKTQTTWSDYYTHTIIGGDYLRQKTAAFNQFMTGTRYHTILDLGCNDGVFSRLCQPHAAKVLSADSDAGCINQLYTSIKNNGDAGIYPLLFDAARPAPATGFMNREQESALARLKADLVVALALAHHLAFGAYLGFAQMADMMAALGGELIIEFVAKEDEKARQLLRHRTDIFDWYTKANFEAAFAERFQLVQAIPLLEGKRILYKMIRK